MMYKPGWSFTATDHSKRFEGSICLRVEYPARETSRDDAFEGYPNENRPYATFPIVVRDLDDSGLYYAILKVIMSIEEHEAREFLRIRPTGWAPFHPHAIDGMRRWREACNCPAEQLESDLQFGIA